MRRMRNKMIDDMNKLRAHFLAVHLYIYSTLAHAYKIFARDPQQPQQQQQQQHAL